MLAKLTLQQFPNGGCLFLWENILKYSLFLSIQAQFADLNLASYSDSGTMVDIQVYREGTVVVR